MGLSGPPVTPPSPPPPAVKGRPGAAAVAVGGRWSGGGESRRSQAAGDNRLGRRRDGGLGGAPAARLAAAAMAGGRREPPEPREVEAGGGEGRDEAAAAAAAGSSVVMGETRPRRGLRVGRKKKGFGGFVAVRWSYVEASQPLDFGYHIFVNSEKGLLCCGVMAAKIRVVLKSFTSQTNQISGLMPSFTKKVGLPESRALYTVLRSPHIDKKSREQFSMHVKKMFVEQKAQTHELHKKLFWLKRLRVPGAQYEVQICFKTRLNMGSLKAQAA